MIGEVRLSGLPSASQKHLVKEQVFSGFFRRPGSGLHGQKLFSAINPGPLQANAKKSDEEEERKYELRVCTNRACRRSGSLQTLELLKGLASPNVSVESCGCLGFSASLFKDVDSFVMDKEDPPEYIPAPLQNAADLEVSKQLENVLYTLREVLPGSMCKIGMDDKLLEAWKLVHHDIKVQDPLVRLQGKDKLLAWLQALAVANAELDLREIYGERILAPPSTPGKICIYVIWTLLIPGKLQSNSKPSTFEGEEKYPSELCLSGESKFEIDEIGQVASIESKWYVPDGGEELLEFFKKYLISLLPKETPG